MAESSEKEPKKNADAGAKTAIALREEATLAFWRANQIFEKTLENTQNGKEFIFYDGPPFATGEPHYGHILAGTIKDTIPRYKTMRGFHVPRRWGWDCHGLPVENLIERELGLASRKAIEEYGIEKFNAAAKASVLRYDAVWKEIVPRTGRFVDMDDAYLTMDWRYTESIWWSFKRLNEKGLVYQDFKPMHLCPHDETTLSNMEVGLNYKEMTDISVYVKFELVDEPGVYLLAWTTTPWTLPANSAIAVNPKMVYVRATVETKEGNVKVVVAKERLSVIKDSYKIEREFLGAELVGKKYKPIFPYYKEFFLRSRGMQEIPFKDTFSVLGANFVTTTDGTGLVHIAPAHGEDDFSLTNTYDLGMPYLVGMDGRYLDDAGEFAGQLVKPKPTKEEPDANQKTDIEIIKYLAKHGALFAKEKIKHAYPCCWRCDTPLLNYATNSWFVEVTALKDTLVSENRKVKWVPPEIGDGRFGDWLANAKDWAVSRSRFWGAPLPVWRCEECQHTEFIGSVEELAAKLKRNNYFVMRHGQAESNVANIVSVNEKHNDPLTPTGCKQVLKTAKKLAKDSAQKIDFIFSSPFQRTRETAELVAETLGYKGEIVFDNRLRELGSFSFEGKSRADRDVQYTMHSSTVPAGDETKEMAAERIKEFFYEIDQKYADKNILVVSHAGPLLAFGPSVMDNAEVRPVPFTALPHDAHFKIDLHRPFIDSIHFPCAKCGEKMTRVPDVFDTWYESGSMPFASVHFPFEQKAYTKPPRFPANFIAEGQDQTRGWFYSLLVLGCGLFGQSPYENVVVNGIILDETGRQKLSKKLKNYPDISLVLNKYGADAMRYYLLSSPVVKAEDLAFSEKGLDEVVKKVINRLDNVYAFYVLYADGKIAASNKSKNILDQWILARLAQVGGEVTDALERYELDKATRPLGDFLDDLSTWYVRRSRDRFKGEDAHDAIATTRFVFIELAKLLAPFMPFAAEDLYQKVKTADAAESVHLEAWPEFKKPDLKLLEEMKKTRQLVSLALEARAAAGIKIRQPLSIVTIGREGVLHPEFQDELYELMKDELNVKKIVYTSNQTELVTLDTAITPELRLEGVARDLVRFIQELRKKKGLLPSQDITLTVATSPEGHHALKMFMDKVKNITRAKELVFVDNLSGAEKITIEGLEFSVGIES